jgi:putative aminopeptidase FrvX
MIPNPMINKITQGDLACGRGPVVSYAPAVQNNLNKLLIETAQKAGIPFQRQASSRSTGTDTDAFAYSNDGVPSALISLPLRYMHTTVEMIHKEDVDNVIRLIYETLVKHYRPARISGILNNQPLKQLYAKPFPLFY